MTADTTTATRPPTIVSAEGFVAHGLQEWSSDVWYRDPATDRWYLERQARHDRPPRVDEGYVVIEWTLQRGRVFRGLDDDEGSATALGDTIVYCVARGPMTEAEAVAWRRDFARDAWAAELAHRVALPVVHRARQGDPMTATDAIRLAAAAHLVPTVVDGSLWWASRRGPHAPRESVDPTLVLLLERFAPLVVAHLGKVQAPPCARCKREAGHVEALTGRLLCDRHVLAPLLAAVEPSAAWLAERAALPGVIAGEDPDASRRAVARGDLEASRMPVPRAVARSRGRW